MKSLLQILTKVLQGSSKTSNLSFLCTGCYFQHFNMCHTPVFLDAWVWDRFFWDKLFQKIIELFCIITFKQMEFNLIEMNLWRLQYDPWSNHFSNGVLDIQEFGQPTFTVNFGCFNQSKSLFMCAMLSPLFFPESMHAQKALFTEQNVMFIPFPLSNDSIFLISFEGSSKVFWAVLLIKPIKGSLGLSPDPCKSFMMAVISQFLLSLKTHELS